MATIQGLNGLVTRASDLDEWHLKEDAFTADITYATVETTGFVDAGNQTHAHVGIGISGTITGTGESGSANTSPFGSAGSLALGTEDPTGTLTLQYNTSCTLAFTALLTTIATARAQNGKLDITQSYVGSGAITVAWVEA